MEIKKTAEEYVLESEQWVPRPLDEVFAFFSRAENLESLTPAFLGFRIVGMSTPELHEGTLIEYRLRVHGFPVRWTTRIEEWNPGIRFVDTQLRGPYALWHHTHAFEAKDGGTLMKDRVRFRLPFGRPGDLFGSWLVKKDVRAIFDFRRKTIESHFPAAP